MHMNGPARGRADPHHVLPRSTGAGPEELVVSRVLLIQRGLTNPPITEMDSISGSWELVFLDEEIPVVALVEYDGAEVSVVPRQDPGIADRSHGHDREVGQVDAGVGVSVGEVEDESEFGVGWRLESVDTIEEGASEGGRSTGVSSGAQQQIDLGVHGPRDHDVTGGPGQQLGRKPMASAFASVEGRYQRSAVGDDQPASRASTSSMREERSSSSSTIPAYGSGAGGWETSSVIKDEKDVWRRSASRSSRAATAGGREIVRRTVAIFDSMNGRV